MKMILLATSLTVFVLTSTEALADGFRLGEWAGHIMGGGMIFGLVMMVTFFALIVFLATMIFRWISGSGQPEEILASKSALDFLNERFAKGEIEKDEYEYEECKNLLLS